MQKTLEQVAPPRTSATTTEALALFSALENGIFGNLTGTDAYREIFGGWADTILNLYYDGVAPPSTTRYAYMLLHNQRHNGVEITDPDLDDPRYALTKLDAVATMNDFLEQSMVQSEYVTAHVWFPYLHMDDRIVKEQTTDYLKATKSDYIMNSKRLQMVLNVTPDGEAPKALDGWTRRKDKEGRELPPIRVLSFTIAPYARDQQSVQDREIIYVGSIAAFANGVNSLIAAQGFRMTWVPNWIIPTITFEKKETGPDGTTRTLKRTLILGDERLAPKVEAEVGMDFKN